MWSLKCENWLVLPAEVQLAGNRSGLIGLDLNTVIVIMEMSVWGWQMDLSTIIR